MYGSKDRVFFQTKIDRDLFIRFRSIQQEKGRTTRSMIEEYMYDVIDEHKKWGMHDAKRKYQSTSV